MNMNILISGVGGQGTLLASRIIGSAAISCGYDVKLSEIHGMSQRGGSVVTYVKYSDSEVNSPVISEGSADIILAFELLEAYRNINYIKPNGMIFVNTQQINPMPVITGASAYPEEITKKINDKGISLTSIDAQAAAREAGNEKAVNTVLIGLLASRSGFSKEVWTDAIKALVPAKLLDVNLRAFEMGYGYNEMRAF